MITDIPLKLCLLHSLTISPSYIYMKYIYIHTHMEASTVLFPYDPLNFSCPLPYSLVPLLYPLPYWILPFPHFPLHLTITEFPLPRENLSSPLSLTLYLISVVFLQLLIEDSIANIHIYLSRSWLSHS